MGGNTHAFFFILNLTLMHRKFDQNGKALLQRTLPRLFSLPSVIRKSAATVWPAAIHVSSFPPTRKAVLRITVLDEVLWRENHLKWGQVPFSCPFLHFTLPDWLSQLYSLNGLCHQPDGEERAWAACWWLCGSSYKFWNATLQTFILMQNKVTLSLDLKFFGFYFILFFIFIGCSALAQ